MNSSSTLQLPDGTIKVEKVIYRSDFDKIKKALKTISKNSDKSEVKNSGDKKLKDSTDS